MTGLTDTSHRLPIHPRFIPEAHYRPFFITGILVILTVGAGWGAWLLWRIGQSESFTDISIHAINAHGHAQIFGWVGLFIMGFAYQAFPRMWNTRLLAPHLALTVFALMLIGLVVRTIGMGAAETWAHATSAVLIGGMLQLFAAMIFAGQIALTYRRSDEPVSPATAFKFAALFWFVAMTAAGLWHTVMLIEAPTREALLEQIATYQAALRDMQIHGMALCMILGVAMRFFPGMFGLSQTSAKRGWWGFTLITAAIVAEIVLLVAARITGNYALAGGLIVAWAALATGIAILVAPWRLWRPLPKPDRSAKFVRIAFLWLAISLLMLLALPLYAMAHETEFSHAYYGAIRHAVTVGFISMMIMGMAAKVVPVLNGVDPRALSALWGPFLLVNIGCALRVSSQVLTDWYDGAYAIIGFSGAMELTGLAWWGAGLIGVLWRGRRGTLPQPPTPKQTEEVGMHEHCSSGGGGSGGGSAVVSPDAIHVDMTIREIAETYPKVQPALTQLGLDTCCSAERTLREIAEQRGIAPDDLRTMVTRS